MHSDLQVHKVLRDRNELLVLNEQREHRVPQDHSEQQALREHRGRKVTRVTRVTVT